MGHVVQTWDGVQRTAVLLIAQKSHGFRLSPLKAIKLLIYVQIFVNTDHKRTVSGVDQNLIIGMSMSFDLSTHCIISGTTLIAGPIIGSNVC